MHSCGSGLDSVSICRAEEEGITLCSESMYFCRALGADYEVQL